jgi:hypothetical protein
MTFLITVLANNLKAA